jgi:plastocyanin
MKRTLLLSIVAAALASSIPNALAGDISGTVTLKGTPPAEKPIDKSADKNCGTGGGPATTHHYIVGSKGELANAVVALKGMDGKSTGTSAAPAVLDQKNCEYAPVILAVQTGQKIAIKNSDPTLHNVHAVPTAAGNIEKNQAQAPNAPDLTFSFPKAENFLKFQCDVHNWMFSWVSVFDHPYFAVSDKDGKYTIKNVPDGKYTVLVMHRKAAPASSPVTEEIEVKGGAVTKDFTLEAK